MCSLSGFHLGSPRPREARVRECDGVPSSLGVAVLVSSIFIWCRSARADAGRLWELMQAARKARVFCRFVVPVIHYKGRVSAERVVLEEKGDSYLRFVVLLLTEHLQVCHFVHCCRNVRSQWNGLDLFRLFPYF